jgi:hypothetical protein
MEDKLPPVMTATNAELQQFINKCENDVPTYVIVSIMFHLIIIF